MFYKGLKNIIKPQITMKKNYKNLIKLISCKG